MNNNITYHKFILNVYWMTDEVSCDIQNGQGRGDSKGWEGDDNTYWELDSILIVLLQAHISLNTYIIAIIK